MIKHIFYINIQVCQYIYFYILQNCFNKCVFTINLTILKVITLCNFHVVSFEAIQQYQFWPYNSMHISGFGFVMQISFEASSTNFCHIYSMHCICKNRERLRIILYLLCHISCCSILPSNLHKKIECTFCILLFKQIYDIFFK